MHGNEYLSHFALRSAAEALVDEITRGADDWVNASDDDPPYASAVFYEDLASHIVALVREDSGKATQSLALVLPYLDQCVWLRSRKRQRENTRQGKRVRLGKYLRGAPS